MKKKFPIILLVFFIGTLMLLFYYKSKNGTSLFSSNTFVFNESKERKINLLTNSEFYGNGIITYNNKSILYTDFEGNLIWENGKEAFYDKIYINKDIFCEYSKHLSIINNKGEQTEIFKLNEEEILFIKSEKNKIVLITEESIGNNSLFIFDNLNEVVLSKTFVDKILSVSINEKADNILISSFHIDNGSITSNMDFYLLDDLLLWNKTLINEIILYTEIVDNKVYVFTDKSIYLINSHGDLLWQNNSFEKILDYGFSSEKDYIYLLVENKNLKELLKLSTDGKVIDKINISENFNYFKIVDNNIFLYDKRTIARANNDVENLLWDSSEELLDFLVIDDKMYILFENKLIEGDIIYK